MDKKKSSGNKDGLSYEDSGVSIDSGNRLVQLIKPIVEKTNRPELLMGLGGFGGLFELPKNLKNPVLVSGTDGVGTKLRIAMIQDKYDTIGIDLVAMCVNDIIVTGAEPLFFLDYYATGHLDVTKASKIIEGIANGCVQSNCTLVGGETAEMPGMYHGKDFDLAGFAVGVVEKEELINIRNVKEGDELIGLKSTGPHSNGYSLIRKIIEKNNADLNENFGNSSLGEVLLQPTKIYVESILKLIKEMKIHSIAHITGGGLTDNIPRVIPPGYDIEISLSSWKMPEIFQWIQEQGHIRTEEMLRTFNCGVGMVICVSKNDVGKAKQILKTIGEEVIEIGKIIKSKDNQSKVIYQ